MPDLIPRAKNVTLDGSGNGTVTFAIDGHDKRWVITYVHVLTSQALNSSPVPACQFFKNGTAQQQSIGGTFSGNMDTATGRVVMYPDDTLYCVWTGGIPATLATAIIAGEFIPDGQPIPD